MTLHIVHPDWVTASSPAAGDPLVPRVERFARPVREAVTRLATSVEIPFEALYRPDRAGLGFTLEPYDVALRSAWAIMGEWLVAAAVGAPCASEGLAAVHEWFWQGSNRTTEGVPDTKVTLELEDPVAVRALLPYLLDPMAAATRRDVLRAQTTLQERQRRKALGVFYTPGDVAVLLVRRLLETRSASATDRWIDPAHGSGVFLRAAYSLLSGNSDMADRIYGIDIDPFAAEAASFVLTAEDLVARPDGGNPWERWHRFRRNLATGDSLLLDLRGGVGHQSLMPLADMDASEPHGPLGRIGPWCIQDAFPEIGTDGFARVIANPPYAPLRGAVAARYLPQLHRVTGDTAKRDISPVFVELCAGLAARDGAFAVVLPLSVVTSTQAPFPSLRRYLANRPGRLEFLSFDRAPDALFGDDIKTRNSIVVWESSGGDAGRAQVITSPLYRWTSRNRDVALAEIPRISLGCLLDGTDVIPKIGRPWELELLLACRRHPAHLARWVLADRRKALEDIASDVGAGESLVAVAPTSYNFISAVRDPKRPLVEGHTSRNAFSVLEFKSEVHASAAYALLNSRLAFWLWNVTGDGFHVTRSLYQLLPVPDIWGSGLERLAILGDCLWKRAVEAPVTSVNAGKRSVSYPVWRHTDLIDEIDDELGSALGVHFRVDLQAWYKHLVTVGRDTKLPESTREMMK